MQDEATQSQFTTVATSDSSLLPGYIPTTIIHKKWNSKQTIIGNLVQYQKNKTIQKTKTKTKVFRNKKLTVIFFRKSEGNGSIVLLSWEITTVVRDSSITVHGSVIIGGVRWPCIVVVRSLISICRSAIRIRRPFTTSSEILGGRALQCPLLYKQFG